MTQPLAIGEGQEIATFGQGCFWGTEKAFRRKFKDSGLVDAQVGYAGGHADNVNYKQVCTGATGHAEVIQVVYDPKVLSYKTLVDFFYRSHDPLTKNKQGNDTGTQYRSAVFYHNEEQKKIAEEGTVAAQIHYGSNQIQTTIEPVGKYYPAEDYHQEYLHSNPNGYECATHFERSWEKIEAKYKN
ncbi:Peptide-methionine (S)-S-oxide reductase [Terramyces sp. JEL0728]|nr:Peptide-methionine (S)-S-oxide reductase [Terramyces sp. JEL0728]